jgi:hypothetical protein
VHLLVLLSPGSVAGFLDLILSFRRPALGGALSRRLSSLEVPFGPVATMDRAAVRSVPPFGATSVLFLL